MQEQRSYQDKVRVGAAGGIGSPEAAASAFLLGADFILTGSINQCTVEAGTSDAVKDMLQGIGVRDTAYAPAGDMFEMGSKIQVMKKGVFFPARASKLYDLWRTHGSLDQIDAATRSEVQDTNTPSHDGDLPIWMMASRIDFEVMRATMSSSASLKEPITGMSSPRSMSASRSRTLISRT